ncbi:hypothetical protein NSK_005778 [Nannochloropsis salina CCMP1776]|uniref:Uncharacterized protein n=1 Tax=Nannochloropsis salina CCMP1776 TaxID=1027361 RepID=A0A4D9CUK5_9STRA|nr:hypothetical protein NSK_005778 [Nannochloropsis salina CCMP1776]|eukprot:TFJ82922.1 hypothetical protein NSK_005778 [Nannochloropsis salina CCMP1776]
MEEGGKEGEEGGAEEGEEGGGEGEGEEAEKAKAASEAMATLASLAIARGEVEEKKEGGAEDETPVHRPEVGGEGGTVLTPSTSTATPPSAPSYITINTYRSHLLASTTAAVAAAAAAAADEHPSAVGVSSLPAPSTALGSGFCISEEACLSIGDAKTASKKRQAVEEALEGFDPQKDRIFPRDDSLEEREGAREGGEEGGREEGGPPFPFGTGSEDGILDGVSDVLGAVTGGLWPDEGRETVGSKEAGV